MVVSGTFVVVGASVGATVVVVVSGAGGGGSGQTGHAYTGGGAGAAVVVGGCVVELVVGGGVVVEDLVSFPPGGLTVVVTALVGSGVPAPEFASGAAVVVGSEVALRKNADFAAVVVVFPLFASLPDWLSLSLPLPGAAVVVVVVVHSSRAHRVAQPAH